MTTEDFVSNIVDLMEIHSKEFMNHPNDTAKLYAVSRLIDQEVGKRMAIINERNENVGNIFVGHCGSDNLELENSQGCVE